MKKRGEEFWAQVRRAYENGEGSYEALAERYHIETIPDIVYFKDGKPVDSIIGYGNVGYPELKAFVEKNRG